jgi:magnesium transporter
MASPDDPNGNGGTPGVPEPIVDRAVDLSGRVTKIDAEEIKELAEGRTGEERDDASQVVEVDRNEALSADELRDAWAVLDLDERSDGLKLLEQEDAEELFVSLSAHDQMRLLLHWRPGKRRSWIRLLEPDDAADVVQDAPEDRRGELMQLLDEPTRKEVQALLAYEEDEAGGLMNTRYARLRPNMSADEAIAYLRRQAKTTLETIYTAYVIDFDQKLVGVVSLRDLLSAAPTKKVADIMETDVVRANDEMDQETLSRLFAEHDLTVIPVVDKDGIMKGIVTVDDIVDVVQEEATEDAQKFGGMEALEQPYMQSTLREMIQKRGVWLTVLMVGEMLTATAMGFFEHAIDKVVVLALFIPLIISSGGNSGSQASTLVIRAMALGEVRARDWWRVMRREVTTGAALGGVLGVIGFIRIMMWHVIAHAYGETWWLLGFTVGFSLWGVVMFGTIAGSMLPFVLRRMGADPASASAPFVATLVDVTGVLLYFGIASIFLARLM